MAAQQDISIVSRLTTHPKYRQIALSIYIGVLIVGLFDWLVNRPPTAALPLPSQLRLVIFSFSILSLIGLEFWRTMPGQAPDDRARFHLLSKIILSGLALLVGQYFYTQLLYLVVIFYAELTFSRKWTVLTIGAAFAILFVRLAYGPRRDFISRADMEALLIFVVAVALILMTATLIRNEWMIRLNLQEANRDLVRSHKQLQERTDQVTKLAVVNERNRMARDIHDGLGHHLAAISIQLEMALKLRDRAPEESLVAILSIR